MAVIVDSSVWIDALSGQTVVEIEAAMATATLVLSPVVIAELLSGDTTPAQREVIGELLQEYPLAATPLEHWMGVGALRRLLRSKGINVTIPDAHLAQAALELDGTLVSRDEIFLRISAHTPLRLAQLR